MHGNYEEEVKFKDAEKTLTNFETTHKKRAASCFNCGLGCKSIISFPNGQYASIKCQSYFNFMFAIKICDIRFSAQCFKLCENYGLDVISTVYLTGFAIDLYQRGILTHQDTGGLILKWQDRNVAFSMIEKIANREDIGNILANGVVEASKEIGKGPKNTLII
ncbi:MAG: aldehyde ferredoxin oxidoreductase C-terminal domain-containing protein [Desulfobacterales bacterium]|jgi:aldehyde:ferredoxin oxidoreductase